MKPTRVDPGPEGSGDDTSPHLDHFYRDVPGGPPKPGEPGYLPGQDDPTLAAPHPNAPKALKAYRDQLDFIVDEEGKFLAKMWATAKYLGRHEEFTKLLGTAMKLRPDKVLDAAEVMSSLASIYEAIADEANDAWSNTYDIGWRGAAAFEFDKYFTQLIAYVEGGNERTFRRVASLTGSTFYDFGQALKKWRSDMAVAIKEVAKMDSDWEKLAELGNDLILAETPQDRAVAVLEALLQIWDEVDKQAKENKEILRKFSEKLDIDLKTPKNADITHRPMHFNDVPSGRLK